MVAAVDVVLMFDKTGFVRFDVLGERRFLRLPGIRRGGGEGERA